MGIAERQEREREKVRSKILSATRELLAEVGHEATTMRKIAERIEYSPTAIYFHFKDKASLIRALCDVDSLNFAHRLAPITKTKDPLKRLRQMGGVVVDFAKAHPNHYRVMFMSQRPPVQDLAEHPHRGNPENDAYAFLRDSVAEAMREGKLRKDRGDPDLIAQVLWGAVHGIISLRISKSEEEWVDWRPMETSVELVTDLLLTSLQPTKSKARKTPVLRGRPRSPA